MTVRAGVGLVVAFALLASGLWLLGAPTRAMGGVVLAAVGLLAAWWAVTVDRST